MCDEFFSLTKYLASRGLETKGTEQQLIVQASGQLFIGVFVRLEAVFQKKNSQSMVYSVMPRSMRLFFWLSMFLECLLKTALSRSRLLLFSAAGFFFPCGVYFSQLLWPHSTDS